MSLIDDDRDLLSAWRNGDEVAGNELVRRSFRTLFRFFRTRFNEDVPDLVQRTFLACVRRRDAVPDNVAFRAYLLGIARKEMLMYLRKKRRHARVFASQDAVGVATGPSPSGVVALRDEQRLLIRALQQLPLESQLTLELYYWEQLPVADVGHVLGVPPGTVKSRLFRAREQLREHILSMASTERLGRTTAREYESWVRSLKELVAAREPDSPDKQGPALV